MRWAVAWSGMPFYGIRLLEEIAGRIGAPLAAIATRVPKCAVERQTKWGGLISYVEEHGKIRWEEFGDRAPDVFLVSGWATPAFRRLTEEAKNAGARIICMIDNSWRGTTRQQLGRVYYRVFLRKMFDEVLVPGKSGVDFGHKLGHDAERIHEGLYSVDDNVFWFNELEHRSIDILYAGQFIQRKGIDDLLTALNICGKRGSQLRVAMAGGVRTQWPSPIHTDVHVHGLLDPPQLAELMRKSKVFVLPSRLDHWGLVVLEAAQSGCLLVVSDQVGAARDLVSGTNGRTFPAGNPRALAAAMMDLLNLGECEETEGRATSRRLAERYHVGRVGQVVGQLIVNIGQGSEKVSVAS